MQIPDYIQDGKWVHYEIHGGRLDTTRAYQIWQSMKSRCNPDGANQQRHPNYIGCIMSENFKDFQFFAEWCHKQVGYGLEGYEIDKDILVPGNKLYSEDNCVFVPRALNVFLTSRSLHRGNYPQGVCLDRGKFHAQLSINGKKKTLGRFLTLEEAVQAYNKVKEQTAKDWANRLRHGEFIVDERVIKLLEIWQVPNG